MVFDCRLYTVSRVNKDKNDCIGFLVPIGNYNAAAKAVYDLLTDNELYARMSAAGDLSYHG